MVTMPPIVLQNPFLGCVQIFPALVRSLENYVGVT
jgi:hypothetical protein